MSVPALIEPKKQVTLPSGTKVEIRPWNFGDERALLLAKETGDVDQIKRAMVDIVRKCSYGVEPLKMIVADFEFAFLQIRAMSIGETVRQNIAKKVCDCDQPLPEDGIPALVDLRKIEVVGGDSNSKEASNVVEAGRGSDGRKIYIRLKYPTVSAVFNSDAKDQEIMAECIDSVFGDAEMYAFDNSEERLAWVDKLPKPVLNEIVKYLTTAPKVVGTVDWKCPCGKTGSLPIEGMNAFFA